MRPRSLAWSLARSRSRGARLLHTSLPLARDLRLRAHRRAARPDAASTARLVPRALSLPRRAPPPLWETTRAANQSKEKLERFFLHFRIARSLPRGPREEPRDA